MGIFAGKSIRRSYGTKEPRRAYKGVGGRKPPFGEGIGVGEASVEGFRHRMALATINEDLSRRLIHHSDRGCQYCSDAYVSELKKHGISISMTQSGDPLENAVAERANGAARNYHLTYCCSAIKTYLCLSESIHNQNNRKR